MLNSSLRPRMRWLRRLMFRCRHLAIPILLGIGLVIYIYPWAVRLAETIQEETDFYSLSLVGTNRILKLRLHNARKLLYSAHRLERSGQVKILIQRALELLNTGEQDEYPNQEQNKSEEVTSSVNDTLRETCPERWGDVRKDSVYFENVYEIIPCKRIQLEQLVELLIYTETCTEATYLVKRIRLIYPNLIIRLAVLSEHACGPMHKVFIYNGLKDEGKTWKHLASNAERKYILVGRNMVDFTYYTDIDRMLRVINSLGVDVVGGAVRLEPEGRWYFGCYQSSMRNFTLRIHPGHDQSAQSCAYCDYIASPFLVKRDLFLKVFRGSILPGLIPFVEFFLKGLYSTNLITHQSLVCVDVLFHVHGSEGPRGRGIAELTKAEWRPLAKLWSLNRIVLPGGVDHQWSCEEVNIECKNFKLPGLMMPPCCFSDLGDCLKGFLSASDRHNVTSYIVSGTAMGAVKMYSGFLPWERDGDICWDAYKHDLVSGPIADEIGRKYGCKLSEKIFKTPYRTDIRACAKVTQNSCLRHQMYSKNWEMDLYGEPILTCNRLWGLKNPTMVNFNGRWTRTVPNPGRLIRHTYGDNVLGHVQHWRDLSQTTGWSRYTNVERMDYPPCPKHALKHACLAGNYVPHGNIQFQDFPL